MKPLEGKQFAEVLVGWQKQHGRQSLPWQHTGSAYKVWLSEVMLQQTQVATVLAYYARFLDAYPTVADLAAAPEQAVMQLWAGLGYYSRARNLHACAKQVVERFGGEFPRSVADLESLPGIGRSTAGAIASLAYAEQASILDGNVKRVFCRYYGVEGYAEQSAIKKALWQIADRNVPASVPGTYNQALMDLGATCCIPRNPRCAQCPLQESCEALRKGVVHQLPTPKPKKARPELHFLSLVVQNPENGLMLELQAEKGVWQGLWTPPFTACRMEANMAELVGIVEGWGASYGLQSFLPQMRAQLDTLHRQPWLVHELTHRKLHFRFLRLRLQAEDLPSSLPFFSLEQKPVPKIVHKLVAQLSTPEGLAQAPVPQQDALDF